MLRWFVLIAAACLGACAAPAAVPQPVATDAGARGHGPVPVPEHGAFFGAWVRPESYSQNGRLDSIRHFESRLGRRLDIVHSYRRLHESIGTKSDLVFLESGATLMFSWAGGSSQDIVSGALDREIRAHARQIRDLGRPVLLRLRWEMDRPNLAASVGSPALYRQAWHHVRRVFETEQARNVAWVFCPTAEGFQEARAADFYPGDDSVDWTCVDVYAGSKLRPMAEMLEPFLRWASRRPKPIMIGEYGVSRAWSPGERAAWVSSAATVFRSNPQIKAVLYFESNPDGRTDSGEFALRDDPEAFAAFRAAARDPYFNTR